MSLFKEIVSAQSPAQMGRYVQEMFAEGKLGNPWDHEKVITTISEVSKKSMYGIKCDVFLSGITAMRTIGKFVQAVPAMCDMYGIIACWIDNDADVVPENPAMVKDTLRIIAYSPEQCNMALDYACNNLKMHDAAFYKGDDDKYDNA
jgi:hypothetical protein